MGFVGLGTQSFVHEVYPQPLGLPFNPHNLPCRGTEWLHKGAVVGISQGGCMEEEPSLKIGEGVSPPWCQQTAALSVCSIASWKQRVVEESRVLGRGNFGVR